ncbi:DUF4350 domain-containing protein [Altericista sp. CCNU0014]|uniref:DUF4350 domain-containing protein n=1 Tax=Altericista sp. CCNU0014 TaxID=3082949 RepID=UPI00384C0760
MAESAPNASRWLSRVPFWGWALVALLCLSVIVTMAAPPSYPKGSSYDRSLSGYAQWYEFMEARNYPVRRWRQSYSRLEGEGQTLVQVADVEVFQNPNLESPEILKWVKQGNTLIVLSWSGNVSGAPFRSELPTPKGAVQIETTRRYGRRAKKFDTVLLKDGFGAAVGVDALEQGRVMRSVYPWLGSGIYANKGANFQVLADLAAQRKGTIWVDEWIHGYRDLVPTPAVAKVKDRDLWGYLTRRPIAVMAGQGLLLLLLLLWGQNQRFGALLKVAPPPRNSSEQYIQALADTLNTHGHTEYVLTLLGQSLRDRLRSRLGLLRAVPSVEGDRAIAAEWATATGRPASELLELLKQSNAERSGAETRLKDSELLVWVQQADTILRGLS